MAARTRAVTGQSIHRATRAVSGVTMPPAGESGGGGGGGTDLRLLHGGHELGGDLGRLEAGDEQLIARLRLRVVGRRPDGRPVVLQPKLQLRRQTVVHTDLQHLLTAHQQPAGRSAASDGRQGELGSAGQRVSGLAGQGSARRQVK